MIKRPLLILLLMAHVAIPLSAQVVDLKIRRLPELPQYYVKDVILVQEEQRLLGRNRYTNEPIKFKHDIASEVKEYFQARYPYRDHKTPLILRINKVRASRTAAETYQIELGISFIAQKDQQHILLLHTGNLSSLAPIEGNDISLAFKQCFDDLARRSETNTLLHRVISKDELGRPPEVNAQEFPILAGRAPARGVIWGYSDLIDNRIDTSIVFSVNTLRNVDSGMVLVRYQKRDLYDIWGVCDGMQYYRLENEHIYIPVQFTGEGAIAFSHDRSGNYIGQDSVELYTGLLARWYNAPPSPEEQKIVAHKMDIMTNSSYYEDPDPELLFVHSKHYKKGEICIYIDDQKLACLQKGDHVRYRYDHPRENIKCTFISEDAAAELLIDPYSTQKIEIWRCGKNRIRFKNNFPPLRKRSLRYRYPVQGESVIVHPEQ